MPVELMKALTISLIIDFLGDANPRNKRSFNSYRKVQVCILYIIVPTTEDVES